MTTGCRIWAASWVGAWWNECHNGAQCVGSSHQVFTVMECLHGSRAICFAVASVRSRVYMAAHAAFSLLSQCLAKYLPEYSCQYRNGELNPPLFAILGSKRWEFLGLLAGRGCEFHILPGLRGGSVSSHGVGVASRLCDQPKRRGTWSTLQCRLGSINITKYLDNIVALAVRDQESMEHLRLSAKLRSQP